MGVSGPASAMSFPFNVARAWKQPSTSSARSEPMVFTIERSGRIEQYHEFIERVVIYSTHTFGPFFAVHFYHMGAFDDLP